jgi:ATP-binding cassette, subfamily B (MDR/TAP), member 1
MTAVQSAIANGTTVLMIAHRLSTVLGVDHITVVQDGRAVEHGKPNELIAQDGIFAGLLSAQNTTAEAHSPAVEFEENKSHMSEKFSLDQSPDLDPEEPPQQVAEPDPTLRTVLARFLRLTRSDHLIISAGIFASIISGAMIIGEAIVFGSIVQLLNVDIDRPNFKQQANFYCLMFFVLACIALLAFVGSGVSFGIASSRLVTRVQAMLLHNVLHLDMVWFAKEGRSANELSSTFAKDASDLACLSGVALGTVCTVIVSVFGGIALAHAVAWKIAVVLLSAVPVMLASGFVRLRLLAQSERRHRTAYSDATSLAVETCQGRKTVAILGLEDSVLQRYHDALRKPYKAGLSYTVFCNIFLALSLAITYFVYALAYWW